MFTQCTVCQQQHSLTIKQLRDSQGMLRCSECSAIFNALQQLSDTPQANPDQPNAAFYPRAVTSRKTTHWHRSTGLCLLTLSLQVCFFEGYRFTQNNILRPWLTQLCRPLNCKLPAYKNLNELTILHGSIQTISQQHSIFRITFVNHAMFEQRLPSIKLTLQNFTGDDFAQRIFYPKDYMGNQASVMKPDMSIEIALDIATPVSNLDGYRFKLI